MINTEMDKSKKAILMKTHFQLIKNSSTIIKYLNGHVLDNLCLECIDSQF